MATKLCALCFGLIYLLFGICGLFPSLVHLPPDQLRFYDVELVGRWGFLFGWMPVNLIHDIVYILLGGGGILAFPSFRLSPLYCRLMFAVAFLFTVLGFLPLGVSYVWGLMPLFGWNIMFHVVTAIVAYYYGWVYPLDLGGPEPVSEMI